MKRISIFIALIALVLSAQAKPARQGIIRLQQSDGTSIEARLFGDEFYHYYTTPDGEYRLTLSEQGMYERTALPTENERRERWAKNPRLAAKQKAAGVELNLAPRGLMILVNFANLSFKTDIAEIDSMINGLDYKRRYFSTNELGKRVTITSKGSARQYFHDTSMGQYNPVFDVVGPVTLPSNYSYYGGNDRNGNDKNVEKMIKQACEAVEDQVDFTVYDNNNDGYVDFVYVLYAGYGEADGAGDDYIWPHNYHLSYSYVNCVVDGKTVDNYACSNELDYFDNEHDGIGTFCHEFSHVLGLPDLYSTDNGTHKTMGAWDILDYGPYNNQGNTPPNYSAYERFFMGWLQPTLINEASFVTIGALGENNVAGMITASGTHNMQGTNPNPKTFYMLENRQKKGWDEYLPGHGLLITRINFNQSKWTGNTVNNSSSSMGVDIIEADGSTPSYNQNNPNNGYLGKLTDAYPAGSDSFTDVDAYQITYIDEENGIITFLVNGGGDPIVLSVEDAEQEAAVSAKKILRNGQIFIEMDGLYYDILGNRR